MGTLFLKFAVRLRNTFDTFPKGPLFHRWFPNGEEDAIALVLSPNAELKLWFDRMESRRGGLEDSQAVAPEVIARLGKVEAGPLRGLLEVRGRSREEIESLRNNKLGDPNYIQLGKLLVKDLLYPPLSRFISTIRTNYGQHWIEELPAWDSRTYSLGSYCSTFLNLKCSTDGGDTWGPFQPDERMVMLEARFSGDARYYRKYLTQDDWRCLQETVSQGYMPSHAAKLVAKAHQLFDLENIRFAFIEGVTALELAISELINRTFRENPPRELMEFAGLPVKKQLIAVAAVSGLLSEEDLQAGIKAIDIRNEIVHEGVDPHDEKRTEFYGLLKAISKLLLGPTFKFPQASSGNLEMRAERWEELENESGKGSQLAS